MKKDMINGIQLETNQLYGNRNLQYNIIIWSCWEGGNEGAGDK